MKKFITLIIHFVISISLFASHQAGGEITYQYLGNNTYKISLIIYQDCLNGAQEAINNDNPAFLSIFKNSNNALIQKYSVNADGPAVQISNNISSNCAVNIPQICIKKISFTFTTTLPYDAVGYTIAYQRCCRNNSITNIANSGNVGTTLYAQIPSPDSGPNNSPIIIQNPPLIICVNNPLQYSYNATDVDGDSLVYELCNAKLGASKSKSAPDLATTPPYINATYNNGYSYNQPIKSTPIIFMDPLTGLLNITPTSLGLHLVTVCIKEYRNGLLIATHPKEFQFFVTNCSKNAYALIPSLFDEPTVHQIVCNGYTVHFKNNSKGAKSFFWDFGDPSTLADTSLAYEPSYVYPAAGTYTAKLIIDKGMECIDSTQKYVKVYPYFKTDFSYDGIPCPGYPYLFIDSSYSTLAPPNVFQWNFNDGNYSNDSIAYNSFPNQTKNFNVILTTKNKFGCVDSESVQIPIRSISNFAGNDTTIIQNEYIIFNSAGDSLNWWIPAQNLNNDSLEKPTGFFQTTGTYTYALTSINANGCKSTDTVNITVSSNPYFQIPTAFSPNGDGKNDILFIIPAGIKRLNSFRIYNRYGQNIFSTSSLTNGWDGSYHGKPVDIGTYYWTAEAVDLRNKTLKAKGEITLLK